MATQLPALRRAHGLSQAALARRVGYSASAIARIETGSLAPSERLARLIAAELGCSQWDLLVQTPYSGHGSTVRLVKSPNREGGEKR